MTAPADLNITLDFNALHLGFSAKILQILERAAFALHAADKCDENPGMVPGVQSIEITVRYEPRPAEVLKPEVAAWVVGSALRDCMEETAAFLERTRELCAVVTLGERGQFTTDELFTVVQEPAKKFEKRGFPDKIKFLKDNYGDVLDQRVQYIQGLNDARNCLVHRLGIVGPADIRDGATELLVSWEGFEIRVQPIGSSDSIPVPEDGKIEGGGNVLLRRQMVEKRFAIGQRVLITPADLCGIWMTLNHFGAFTAGKVIEYAKTKGFVFTDPVPPPVVPNEE